MALGLISLGREEPKKRTVAGVAHIVGAATGGAAVGAVLGLMGSMLLLSRWRFMIIVVSVTVALGLSITGRSVGRFRQVPRDWARRIGACRAYGSWGVMLGSGILTFVPYPVFLVLLGAELSSGIALGAAAGLTYGSFREGASLIPVIGQSDREIVLKFLARGRVGARAINMSTLLIGGTLMIVLSR